MGNEWKEAETTFGTVREKEREKKKRWSKWCGGEHPSENDNNEWMLREVFTISLPYITHTNTTQTLSQLVWFEINKSVSVAQHSHTHDADVCTFPYSKNPFFADVRTYDNCGIWYKKSFYWTFECKANTEKRLHTRTDHTYSLSIYCSDPISSFHLLFAHIFSMVRFCIFVTLVTIKMKEWRELWWMSERIRRINQEKHKLWKQNAEFNIMFVWIFVDWASWKLRKTARIQDMVQPERRKYRSQDHYYGLIELVSAQWSIELIL